MLVARFHFKPEKASYWCEGESTVSELLFSDASEVVEFCKEIEDELEDVLVFDGQDIYHLKEFCI